MTEYSHLTVVARTDPGRVRKNNEDAAVVLPEHGVLCLADGMGGGASGEIASAKVVECVAGAFEGAAAADPLPKKCQRIVDALQKASRWINQQAQDKGFREMGSTAVVLVLDAVRPGRGMVLHAGDSRAYRLRAGHVQQLSTDHSVAQAAGVSDAKAMPSIFRGVLTRAVGIQPSVMVELTPVEVQADDLFLLCSDGLSNMVQEKELQEILLQAGQRGLEGTALHLIERANAAGGSDNITAVLGVVVARAGVDFSLGLLGNEKEVVDIGSIAAPETADDAPAPADTADKPAPLITSDLRGSTPTDPAARETGESDTREVITPGTVPDPVTSPQAGPRTAVAPLAGGRHSVILIVIVAVVLFALSALLIYLLRLNNDTTGRESPPGELPPSPAVPPPEQARPPLTKAQEAILMDMRVAVSRRIDETCETGAWNSFEQYIAESLVRLGPGFDLAQLMPDENAKDRYDLWRSEWHRAAESAPETIDTDAMQVVVSAGLAAMDMAPPASAVSVAAGATAAERADAHCRRVYRLQADYCEGLRGFIEQKHEQLRALGRDPSPTLKRLQEAAEKFKVASQPSIVAYFNDISAQLVDQERWMQLKEGRPLSVNELTTGPNAAIGRLKKRGEDFWQVIRSIVIALDTPAQHGAGSESDMGLAATLRSDYEKLIADPGVDGTPATRWPAAEHLKALESYFAKLVASKDG
jgi:PPM family protein phosphatase